jgi:hypothetical protein
MNITKIPIASEKVKFCLTDADDMVECLTGSINIAKMPIASEKRGII